MRHCHGGRNRCSINDALANECLLCPSIGVWFQTRREYSSLISFPGDTMLTPVLPQSPLVLLTLVSMRNEKGIQNVVWNESQAKARTPWMNFKRGLKTSKIRTSLPGQGWSSGALGDSLRCSGNTLWFHLCWIKLIEIQSPSQHTTFPLVRSEVWKKCFAFSVGCPAPGLKYDRLWRVWVTGNFNIPSAQSFGGIREIENKESYGPKLSEGLPRGFPRLCKLPQSWRHRPQCVCGGAGGAGVLCWGSFHQWEGERALPAPGRKGKEEVQVQLELSLTSEGRFHSLDQCNLYFLYLGTSKKCVCVCVPVRVRACWHVYHNTTCVRGQHCDISCFLEPWSSESQTRVIRLEQQAPFPPEPSRQPRDSLHNVQTY